MSLWKAVPYIVFACAVIGCNDGKGKSPAVSEAKNDREVVDTPIRTTDPKSSPKAKERESPLPKVSPKSKVDYGKVIADAEKTAITGVVRQGQAAEAIQVAGAITELNRAKAVADRLIDLSPKDLDASSIRVGQRGFVSEKLTVVQVEEDFVFVRYKSKFYIMEGLSNADKNKLADDQEFTFNGVWNAYGNRQFKRITGTDTFIAMRLEEMDGELVKVLTDAKARIKKAEDRLDQTRKELAEARTKAEAKAAEDAKALAAMRWPAPKEDAPINVRAKAKRDYDEGLEKLLMAARKDVAARYAEPE